MSSREPLSSVRIEIDRASAPERGTPGPVRSERPASVWVLVGIVVAALVVAASLGAAFTSLSESAEITADPVPDVSTPSTAAVTPNNSIGPEPETAVGPDSSVLRSGTAPADETAIPARLDVVLSEVESFNGRLVGLERSSALVPSPSPPLRGSLDTQEWVRLKSTPRIDGVENETPYVWTDLRSNGSQLRLTATAGSNVLTFVSADGIDWTNSDDALADESGFARSGGNGPGSTVLSNSGRRMYRVEDNELIVTEIYEFATAYTLAQKRTPFALSEQLLQTFGPWEMVFASDDQLIITTTHSSWRVSPPQR